MGMDKRKQYWVELRDSFTDSLVGLSVMKLNWGGGDSSYWILRQGGEWEPHKDYEIVKGGPSLQFPAHDAKEIFQEIANELKKKGFAAIETKEEISDLRCMIEAKDAHIADLRKLLRLDTKVPVDVKSK